MTDPREFHWKCLNGLLRYLKGTKDNGILNSRDVYLDDKLDVYVDSSWSDDLQNRHSTTGILVFVGGHLVDWSYKNQSIISVIAQVNQSI